MNEEPSTPKQPRLNERYVRNEIRLHQVFLFMSAMILLLSFVLRTNGPTDVYFPGIKTALPETCSSRRLFGIECPGCGMTRAFIAISRGHWKQAWAFNPVAFVVYAFLAIQIPWHTMQIWRLRHQRLPVTTAWVYALPIMMVVGLIVNWIWKLV